MPQKTHFEKLLFGSGGNLEVEVNKRQKNKKISLMTLMNKNFHSPNL